MSAAADGPGSFRHEALAYPDAARFVPTAVSLVREGVASGERTIVLAPAGKLGDLQDALGHDADDVTFVASDRHARNPARVATILETFLRGAGNAHSRGVSYAATGRTPAATLEARFADSLLNVAALRAWAMSLICLFDLSALDDAARHAIRQGHGVVRDSSENADYLPDLALTLYALGLEPAPPSAARFVAVAGSLPHVRAFVRAQAGAALPADRLDDLILAVNEIVTNSLRYGGGRARLAVWTSDGAVICEVRDRGHLEDPLIGRFAPSPASASGRGIWLAHSLCDLVQQRSSPDGTVVRMHVEAAAH